MRVVLDANLIVALFLPLPYSEQARDHVAVWDRQNLALAEQERADFWTADQRLANGARQVGAGWVHWIGEES